LLLRTLGDEKKTSVQARFYHNPNYFIYDQTKRLLKTLEISISEREHKDEEKQQTWLDMPTI